MPNSSTKHVSNEVSTWTRIGERWPLGARRILEAVRGRGCPSYVLVILHTFLATVAGALYIQKSYVDRTLDHIVSAVTTPAMSKKDQAEALLHVTHDLLSPRILIFGGRKDAGPRETWLNGADLSLMEARGGCGSYAHVLARLLNRAGIDVRIAQMRCGDSQACHILVEANLDERWIVLDAGYDLAFRNPDGSLATFSEVQGNWTHFSTQVPEEYDMSFRYDGVRYTNWNKVPVLMPALRRVTTWILGPSRTEQLSLRKYVLDVYGTYLVLVLVTWFGVGLATARHVRRTRTPGSRSPQRRLARN